jgi:hypothetical protein
MTGYDRTLLTVPKSHTGLTMAKVFAQTLKDFGLSDQVCQH